MGALILHRRGKAHGGVFAGATLVFAAVSLLAGAAA